MALNFADYKNWIPYPTNDDPERKLKVQTYRAAEGFCVNKFKQDFFKELDIENNPKKELLFTKAWDHGHSAGYREVMNYGYDLVELIR